MFVSDSSLSFMGTKLRVISTEGYSWETEFEPTATIDSIKRLAIQYFYPSEATTSPDQFRVIYPAEGRTLLEHHALHEEHIKGNEVLLFVRRRTAANAVAAVPPQPHPTRIGNRTMSQDSEMRPPTAAEILAATKDLPEVSKPQPPSPKPTGPKTHANYHPLHATLYEDSSESNVDFQLELRKIIISLISVMATLLHGNPDADLICKEMHQRIQHRLKISSSKTIEGTKFQYPAPPEIECTPLGIISGLTEAKKREFRPNPKALESLRQMGFQDEQIVDGLRANKNSKDAACEWILSGKGKTDIEADDTHGLDQNSHLFSALVSAPTVRLGLNNPKTLLAFLNILESPASANAWLNDVDTAPVLSSIFKIYHAEKHAAPLTEQS